jgi:hypothetical protein
LQQGVWICRLQHQRSQNALPHLHRARSHLRHDEKEDAGEAGAGEAAENRITGVADRLVAIM